jgi:3-methyladenine DNA glycosylase/8-oxoguanine DNA glycosylase
MAERVKRGELDFSRLNKFTDDEVIAHLTQVKGVGVWTAHMFLMFTLQRPDVLPTGDFGVRLAMKKLYKKRKMPDPKQMKKIAKAWQPYRSVACWYLWRSLDIKVVGSKT